VINAIINFVTGGLVDKVLDLGKAYFAKQISEAEFESRVKIAASDTAARIEQSWAEASVGITKSVQATLKASVVLQRAYAIVLFLQLFVLVWYQLGAPAYEVVAGRPWPQPMASIEWAYLLIGAMVGAGPLVFRR
jgi:hypothetical protein